MSKSKNKKEKIVPLPKKHYPLGDGAKTVVLNAMQQGQDQIAVMTQNAAKQVNDQITLLVQGMRLGMEIPDGYVFDQGKLAFVPPEDMPVAEEVEKDE